MPPKRAAATLAFAAIPPPASLYAFANTFVGIDGIAASMVEWPTQTKRVIVIHGLVMAIG